MRVSCGLVEPALVERNHLRVRGRHLRCPCDWEHVLPEECIKLYVLTSNDLVFKLGCDGGGGGCLLPG